MVAKGLIILCLLGLVATVDYVTAYEHTVFLFYLVPILFARHWAGQGTAFGMAVFCALAAWDLDSFTRRLSFASAEDHPAIIEGQHLLRLSLVLLFAAGTSYLSLSIRFQSNFERAAVLAIFAFGGIAALVSWLRMKES